jgi:hypothetical protein
VFAHKLTLAAPPASSGLGLVWPLRYRHPALVTGSLAMLNPMDTAAATSIEQCVDRLDELVQSLEPYPDAVLAIALRLHLSALLRAMVEQHVCSREDVRQFLVELEQEALGIGED